MKLRRASWFFSKWCASCLRDIFIVVLWLVLIGFGLAQIGLLTAHKLPMPDGLLRQIEARLADAGLTAQIEDASIDLSGRVLLNNVQLATTSFDSPLAKIDTLYIRLNPLVLLARQIDVRYVRASGVNLMLPAMLSPTGRTEEVLSNVCLSFKPGHNELELDQLSGQLANLTVSVRTPVTIPLGQKTDPHASPKIRVAEALKDYISLARKLTEFTPELAALEKPNLTLSLSSASLANAPLVTFTLTSRKMDVDLSRFRPDVGRLAVTDLKLATTLALDGPAPDMLTFRWSCASALTHTGWQLQGTTGQLTGRFATDTFQPLSCVVTADTARVNDFTFAQTLAQLSQEPADPRVRAEITTAALGTTWQISGLADPALGQGTLQLDGALTNDIMQRAEAAAGLATGTLLTLNAPAPVSLTADFAPGWKFQQARGRATFGHVVGYSVPFSTGRATFTFDGTELSVTDIAASQGENAATGSYWMNVKNRDFRFLLAGKLRPADISGFFDPWWANFWQHFDFTQAAPIASVDVAGRWGRPYTTTVLARADVTGPTINAVSFNRVRTTMFIRPDFYDALELKLNKGAGSASGTFTRAIDFYRDDDSLRSLDFDLTSTLDLAETARIFGAEGTETVEPFIFANPPNLHLTGHVDGAASPRGPHRLIQIAAKSTGPFALYEFPLHDLSFNGTINDHDIDLRDIEVTFAQGIAKGVAFLSGPEADRRLRFDCTLSGANLGRAISTLEQFSAQQNNEPAPTASRFQQKLSEGRLDLQLAAQGLYHDPLSFQGDGTLALTGAQLAQINLLGALSQLLSKSSALNFTSLQLDAARAHFSLERNKLVFPDLKITGSSVAVETQGTYLLDKKTMDFAAKVYPFGHGKTLLADAVGFVLKPLTTAMELKLSGPIDKPRWRFAYGPTSLMYTLTGTKPNDTVEPDPIPTDITRKLPPPYLRR